MVELKSNFLASALTCFDFLAPSAEAAIQPKDAQLRVILFNKQGVKDSVIGEADIVLSDLLPNQAWKEWHALGDEKGKAKILLDIHLLTDTVRSSCHDSSCGRNETCSVGASLVVPKPVFVLRSAADALLPMYPDSLQCKREKIV